MSIPPLSSLETIKKWYNYWKKFKGRRVRIWLGRLMKFTKAMQFTGDSFEIDLTDSVVGTISEVIESPFGIMLKEISSAKNIEMIFVPMSEISKIDFLSKQNKQ